MREIEDLRKELHKELKQLQALYFMLAARPPCDPLELQRLRQQLTALQAVPLATDLPYGCAAGVQVGDPVAVVGNDLVDRADAAIPLLAVAFCAVKSSSTQCMVRRVGVVPQQGIQAGRIYYLGAGGGATLTDPNDDPAAKIFQRLAVGKNSGQLDACVTLEFVTLRS